MEAAFSGYYTSAFPKEYVPKLNFLKDSVGSKKGGGGGMGYLLERGNVDILSTNPKFCSFD